MTAARCKCSHTAGTHTARAGQCWSVACGCSYFRPSDTCGYCRGTGEIVDDDGFEIEVYRCTECDGTGAAA